MCLYMDQLITIFHFRIPLNLDNLAALNVTFIRIQTVGGGVDLNLKPIETSA